MPADGRAGSERAPVEVEVLGGVQTHHRLRDVLGGPRRVTSETSAIVAKAIGTLTAAGWRQDDPDPAVGGDSEGRRDHGGHRQAAADDEAGDRRRGR